jgi:hypothetical protein
MAFNLEAAELMSSELWRDSNQQVKNSHKTINKMHENQNQNKSDQKSAKFQV